MGRAKEEWMLREEMQPMYDWIEENFGSDAGEEGSEEWDEAVAAYEEFCESQYQQEEEFRVQEQLDLEWYFISQSIVARFNREMQSVRALLKSDVYNDTQFSLLVMLHGHVVAAVEAYLASKFISRVTNSVDLTRKLVESDAEFAKMKFSMKQIYEKHEQLKLTVTSYLKDLIFHDLKKIKPMFKNVLDFDFGDISWLFKAVSTRHHCVHRAGRDKDDNRIDITTESVKDLVERSTNLVWRMEQQIRN